MHWTRIKKERGKHSPPANTCPVVRPCKEKTGEEIVLKVGFLFCFKLLFFRFVSPLKRYITNTGRANGGGGFFGFSDVKFTIFMVRHSNSLMQDIIGTMEMIYGYC